MLNLLIFAAMWIAGGPDDACVLLRFGAKFNYLIVQGEWWRLLSSIFLHIGIVHLLFNEYALWAFGREIERLFGSVRFTLIYLLAGLFGSTASFALSPAISAGASGAIFGMIGAQVAFFFRNRARFGEMGRRQLTSLLGVIGVNLFLGVTIPGIDNLAHLGGLVTGFLLGLVLTPLYDFTAPDEFRDVRARVVDRNNLARGSWAVALAALILAGLFFSAQTITPISRFADNLVLQCRGLSN